MAFGIDDALLAAAGAQVVGGLMGADASKSAANTQAQAGQAAIGEQKREFDVGQSNLAPYRNVGTSALYTLKDALGLPGGANPADVAALNAAADKMVADKLWDGNLAQQMKDLIEQGPEAMQKAAPWLGASLVNQAGLDNNVLQSYLNPQATTTPNTGSLVKPFSFDISQDPGYQFRLDQGTTALENSAAAKGSQLSGATLKELVKYGSDYASGEFNTAFNRDMATKNQLYSMLAGTAGMGQGATTTGVSAGQSSAANIGNTMTGIGNANAAGIVGSANAMSSGISGAGNTIVNGMTLRDIMTKNNTTAPIMGGVSLNNSGANDYGA